MEQSNPPVQAPFTAACYGAGTFVIDKIGTRFQVWTGRLTNPGPWGPHIFRTVQGGKPELVWFKENANGNQLIVMNKQLWFSYTPARSGQWGQIIDGYIDPSDEPSSKIVDVNASALDSIKQSIATTQSMASNASSQALQAKTAANAANNTAAAALAKVAEQSKQIEQLQAQINALLTPNQVTDLVWSKIWDVNYLIRLGFVDGKSADPSVQNYLVDLAYYIRKMIK